MTIQSFKDLTTWQEGHKLVLLIYQYTSKFPSKETYSLIDKMRRAVVSITSNVAEGFERKGNKEKIQFLHLALGSCYELYNQIIISKDLTYLTAEEFTILENKLNDVSRLINGFIRSLNSN